MAHNDDKCERCMRAALRAAIGSLDAFHDAITRALDLLLHGL